MLLQAERVRNGRPTTTELVVRYEDSDPGRLPLLVVLGNYSVRQSRYRDRDVYHVEEIPAPGGRAFLLHREAAAVEADPDHVERYGVYIAYTGDASNLCECRGHAAHGRCKHIQAVAALLAEGYVPDPLDRPAAARLNIRDDRGHGRSETPPGFRDAPAVAPDAVLYDCPDCLRSHFVTVDDCPTEAERAREVAMTAPF